MQNPKGEGVIPQQLNLGLYPATVRILFRIRDDAVWSNGDPLTAEDFVYSWRRILTRSWFKISRYALCS